MRDRKIHKLNKAKGHYKVNRIQCGMKKAPICSKDEWKGVTCKACLRGKNDVADTFFKAAKLGKTTIGQLASSLDLMP